MKTWRRRSGVFGAVLVMAGTRARQAVVVLAVLLLVAVGSAAPAVSTAVAETAASKQLSAVNRFFVGYLQPDGRVARRDQGGDTVSEGQAYGMALAAASGDRGRFDLIWSWTRLHLLRPDGLLSWHWSNGTVVDPSPATDADLFAAGALARAGATFGDPKYTTTAKTMSSAILRSETMVLGSRRVLFAGPWAIPQRIINPSYFAVAIMSTLWLTTGDHRWADVAAASREHLTTLTANGVHLPPDWATVAADGGSPRPGSAPSGETPRYGYDAARVLPQFAVDCRAAGQQVAARAWPFLKSQSTGTVLPAAVYTLEGRRISAGSHPVALVAAAGAAAAAGDYAAKAQLLDRASAVDVQNPTYYGAAWVALGRTWLDTSKLGGCRPGAPTS